MESMLYQGHRSLGGIKPFWMAVRVWKTNPRSGRLCTSKTEENVTKLRALVSSDRLLTEWSALSRDPWKTQEKGSSCPARDCGHLDAASRKCSLSHCHFSERIFDQKGYSSGSEAPILAWFESVWLLPFPETQISSQKSSFWNCSQHPKRPWHSSWGHFHMKTSSTATGSGSSISGGVWFPRGTIWRG